jgi:hypothetical protein
LVQDGQLRRFRGNAVRTGDRLARHDTVPPVSFTPRVSANRLERWLWTGPVGHLIGGGLDLIEAYTRYAISRLRKRAGD